MPSLTAELLGTLAAVIVLLAIALAVDPVLRERRAANRITRKRRHAAAGCRMCGLAVEALDLDEEVTDAELMARATAEHVAERLTAQRDDRGDGVVLTALVLVVAIAAAFIYVDPVTTVDDVTTAITTALAGATR